MSYTSISTSRPGPRLQAAQTSEELGALMLEVWAVVNANGGENTLTGTDFARGVNISITNYPDAASSEKTVVELTAKQLIEFISTGPFMTLEDWMPIASAAMDGN